MEKLKVDKQWTLFLDRDGVINKKLEDDYIKNVDEFEFDEGVLEILPLLKKKFGRIIVVTNQQGIGRGIMTTEDLNKVHTHMRNMLSKNNADVDAVYHAPQKKLENSIMRKPGIGMPLQAAKDFPEINFSKSVMVGDSVTDIEMGKTLGMKNIFLYQERYELREEIESDYSIEKLCQIEQCIEL